MSRKFLMVLVLVVLGMACVFLFSRGMNSEDSEVGENGHRGKDGDYVGLVEAGGTKEARASRRTNQAKPRSSPVTTASGLTYQVLREGDGVRPGPKDKVTVAYRGWVKGGKEFDKSAEGRPREFPLNMVIKGWQEGMQLMRVGAKYRFTIPPELAYGERGGGNKIPPNATLVFEVELIDVK